MGLQGLRVKFLILYFHFHSKYKYNESILDHLEDFRLT